MRPRVLPVCKEATSSDSSDSEPATQLKQMEVSASGPRSAELKEASSPDHRKDTTKQQAASRPATGRSKQESEGSKALYKAASHPPELPKQVKKDKSIKSKAPSESTKDPPAVEKPVGPITRSMAQAAKAASTALLEQASQTEIELPEKQTAEEEFECFLQQAQSFNKTDIQMPMAETILLRVRNAGREVAIERGLDPSEVNAVFLGSFATHTVINGSDLDIALTGLLEVEDELEERIKLARDTGTEDSLVWPDVEMPLLQKLMDSCAREFPAARKVTIKKYEPFVLKFKLPLNEEMVHVKIVLDACSDLHFVEEINAARTHNPHLENLIVLLKVTVRGQDLLGVLNGGTSSTGLWALALTFLWLFLKGNDELKRRTSLGTVFVECLKWLSSFDLHKNAIKQTFLLKEKHEIEWREDADENSLRISLVRKPTDDILLGYTNTQQMLDACGEVASEIDSLELDLDDRKPAPKPIMDKVNAILQGVIPLDDEVETELAPPPATTLAAPASSAAAATAAPAAGKGKKGGKANSNQRSKGQGKVETESAAPSAAATAVPASSAAAATAAPAAGKVKKGGKAMINKGSKGQAKVESESAAPSASATAVPAAGAQKSGGKGNTKPKSKAGIKEGSKRLGKS